MHTYILVVLTRMHNAIQIQLPAGKRTPRWGHSMTTVLTPSGLEVVIVFGGSNEKFGSEWKFPEFSRLAESMLYYFGQCFILYNNIMFSVLEKKNYVFLKNRKSWFRVDPGRRKNDWKIN